MGIVYQLLLSVKAVVVAVLGDAEALPPAHGHSGHVGMICMYISIGVPLLLSFVEQGLSQSLIKQWKKHSETLLTQPLLGADKKAQETQVGE